MQKYGDFLVPTIPIYVDFTGLSLYYKTRSLLFTISLHMVNNTRYTIILLSPLKDVRFSQMNTGVLVVALLGLIALSAVCMSWLHANIKK